LSYVYFDLVFCIVLYSFRPAAMGHSGPKRGSKRIRLHLLHASALLHTGVVAVVGYLSFGAALGLYGMVSRSLRATVWPCQTCQRHAGRILVLSLSPGAETLLFFVVC
jgi:deoxycytidylate deaminase